MLKRNSQHIYIIRDLKCLLEGICLDGCYITMKIML